MIRDLGFLRLLMYADGYDLFEVGYGIGLMYTIIPASVLSRMDGLKYTNSDGLSLEVGKHFVRS